ncbi:hypothetical protein V6N11_015509 [Hibiscus sabdariffa]|uniref:Uncharacterized protein n=1 Tax=Hibiscus sabdariffa TaxID=183260 RepID=A0ABR2TSJ3_9ROSI
MKEKNMSAKPRMIACNPNRSCSSPLSSPLERNVMLLGLLQHDPEMQPPSLDQKPIDSRPKSDEMHLDPLCKKIDFIACTAFVHHIACHYVPHNVDPTNLFKGRREWSIMKEKNMSAKPRMIACNPNRMFKVQASHPWLPDTVLILMEDLSSDLPRFRIHHSCIDELGKEEKD